MFAMQAELRCVGNLKSDTVTVRVAPRALDHRSADVYPDAMSNYR